MAESEPPGNELVPVFGDSAIDRYLRLGKASDIARLTTSLSFSPNPDAQVSVHEIRPPRQVTITRLKRVLAEEPRRRNVWVDGELPGLIVHHHCASNAVFEFNRQLSALDTAFRRAATVVTLYNRRAWVEGWPRPALPQRCGLAIVDASVGSVDTILVCYGALVQIAQSSPVSVLSLVTLIWDAAKTARRIGSGWILRIRDHDGSLLAEQAWNERVLNSAVPVLLEAIKEGAEVNFELISRHGDSVKLVVGARPTDRSAIYSATSLEVSSGQSSELNPAS